MPRTKDSCAGHTGQTDRGHTRDVKVERIGRITIYKRGRTYYLYYRQGGLSHRRRVEGNLAAARATAHKVQNAIDEGRPSPIAYARTSPGRMVEGYIDAVTNVQKLAMRTRDRYRAALGRFTDFCRDAHIVTIDALEQVTVEDFVKWLRGQKRTRNGAAKGRRDFYKAGGVKFILSTCRTAYNWAARHRMLPPFTQNPFTLYPIEKIKDPERADGEVIFSREQEKAFFDACDDWQGLIFRTLACYGIRLGELTHLLVEDVDFANHFFVIRSKPWLFWSVKTGRERKLPLLPEAAEGFARAIGGRKAGFIFLNREFASGKVRPALPLASPQGFKTHAEKVVTDLLVSKPEADEREQKRSVVAFCRSMGQIPEKRVRCEFMGLTARIGCPGFTRVHDLRHLFTSRAQAAGVNPILVQEMLGHTTLEMTRRYTHIEMESKREALLHMAEGPHAGARPPETGKAG